ncbi:DUF4064 domain-containing protein [Paenibacillus larvae]|uniref:DUF4064 domain-containing protein n=1 Tax=Paenibacillus larvae TaxID=1464 RepID=UPI002E149A7E
MCPNIILTEGYEYGSFHFLEPSFLHNYTDSTALGASGAQSVGTLGFVAILFSILGIIGAAMSKAKPKLAGIFMVVAGIGGFISVSMLYILSAVLLIIGGCMGLFKKTDKAAPTESA